MGHVYQVLRLVLLKNLLDPDGASSTRVNADLTLVAKHDTVFRCEASSRALTHAPRYHLLRVE